jgi:hypothetical protein
VVHVLTKVLEKVHRALRGGGHLLNIQPTDTDATVSVEYNGEVIFSEKFHEPNFMKMVAATNAALNNAIEGGLFTVKASSVDKFVDGYEDVDEWYEKYLKFTEDKPELDQMAEKIRAVVAGLDGEYRIFQSYEEVTTLYEKMD